MIEILHIGSQILGLCFFIFIGYGAFLLVSDSEKRWKERYGNRWFVTPSERERLDKAYAERIENKKATRGVKRTDLHRFVDNRDE